MRMELQASTDGPRVTIAIPTLNRAGYLRLAMESALCQTYANIEVIVSNNASTDDTADLLASCLDPRLHVLSQTTKLSMPENWNACLNAATGEYLLLLSDDDLLERGAVRELLAGYTEPDGQAPPGMVYCGCAFINAAGEITKPFRQSPAREAARSLIPAALEGKRDIRFCAVLLRTADVRPGFPSNFKVACDAAVWMRTVMRYGSAVFIPQQLARYRVHPNLTFTTPLEIWLAEQAQLQQLVLAEDELAGKPDPSFARRLDVAVKRSRLGTITGWINESLRNHKSKALQAYLRHLSEFSCPAGTLFLMRGLITLFLSEHSKAWLRRHLRR